MILKLISCPSELGELESCFLMVNELRFRPLLDENSNLAASAVRYKMPRRVGTPGPIYDSVSFQLQARSQAKSNVLQHDRSPIAGLKGYRW